MEILRKLIKRKFLLHAIFWISLLMLVFAFENRDTRTFEVNFFAQYAISFIVFIFSAYFNIYFLVPRYFKEKRYVRYAVSLSALVIFSCMFIVFIRHLSFECGFLKPASDKVHSETSLAYFFHIMFGEAMLIVLTSLVYILEEWIRFQDITIKMKAIESEKIQSELQVLKAQINPHFLFNTLNNIYSHSLDKSDKVPEMILKLSDLMSYILYECPDEKVLIENEIAFIKNYIELEKIRYESNLNVTFNIENHDPTQKIIPLLFITYIENAFKHNGSQGNKKAFVRVHLYTEQGKIFFRVTNSIGKDIQDKSSKEGGLGIENAGKRLELLYANHHKLTIEKKDTEFDVQLTIFNYGA